ncbi:protein of unknown function DUF265 [Thermocrinis albus DSM 14484]|uniref:Nucleoside-triphosphatase Thal_0164 n=1 Tax=Thermocrinis albus (strain DSM 14484 / JCM 11386 / HI 11/12) TaxID=638303 RepID=D3SNR3_THEAH|nr:NTPase [Thermocrinis albus]ADC88800.1 protein of unknown function DUF265 [Thermocrinis albus DSM 14484]
MKIVITGEPGVGKTTLVKKLVQMLGDRAVGFWTEEIRDKKTGKRTGFKVINTQGQEVVFASKFFTSRHLVGSYGVNVERFEKVALPVLEEAIKAEKDKVVVIDEVGKMELFSRPFRELVRQILHDPTKRVVVTIPIRDVHPLVKEIRRLKGAVLIELTLENRERIHQDIFQLLLTSLR